MNFAMNNAERREREREGGREREMDKRTGSFFFNDLVTTNNTGMLQRVPYNCTTSTSTVTLYIRENDESLAGRREF